MIRDAALAALAAKEAADEVAREQARAQLVEQARATFDQTMRTHDDKLPVAAGKLEVAHVDVDSGLVVLTDGTTAVGVRDGTVRLVADDDGWAARSGPLKSLVELGEALAA